MRDWLARLFSVTPGRPAFVLGLRGAVAIFVPLVVAQLAGHLAFGFFISIGALNTLMADVGGPYRPRATGMAAAAGGGAAAMLVGTLVGGVPWLAAPAMFVWSLAAGMVSIYGNAAAVAGLIVNVAFVLASGLGGSPSDAVERAVAFLLGGAFVMLYSLVLWPFHPYRPVYDAVAGVYQALATLLEAESGAASPPAATTTPVPSTSPAASTAPSAPSAPLEAATAERTAVTAALDAAAQALDAVRAGASGASPTDACLVVLLRAATRLSLAAVAVGRAFEPAARSRAFPALQPLVAAAVDGLANAARAVAASIASGQGRPDLAAADRALAALSAQVHQTAVRQADPAAYHDVALIGDLREALDVVADYLHKAADTAERLHRGLAPTAPTLAAGTGAPTRPSWRETLAAQLSMRSLAFRHALRLAVATAAGVLVYTLLGLPHGLWVTLTTVVILKPSFGTTLDTTLQRVAGTMLGAMLAALLIAGAPSFLWLELVIIPITIICFALKPISYVLFVMLLTPLVIVLIDLNAPGDWTVAAVRVGNTMLGGLLALLASYFLWPAWERERLPQQLAATIRANRAYFQAVVATYLGAARDAAALAAARRRAAREVGNADAAFQRLLGEPKSRRGATRPWHELVTYNQGLLDSATSLDVHATRYSGHHALPGLDTFAQGVADELEALATAVASGAKPGPPSPFDVALAQIRKHVATLEATRTVELAAQHGDTPTVEAVHDFSRLETELDQIAREVTGMHLALEGQ